MGTRAGPLVGGDGEHFFVTPPMPGTAKPTRIWVIGDSGTADANAAARLPGLPQLHRPPAHRRLAHARATTPTSTAPTSSTSRRCSTFTRSCCARCSSGPTIGNHETYYGGPPEQSPYLDIFTLPTRAEAGGLASGSELYYSFDHGNIHFVALDSMVSSRAPGAADVDLAARPTWRPTDKTWLIAFWHHPPYSKGSHDSDNAAGFEPELVDMRERALPILEAYGVDLVLSGHSHSYERSYLLSRHYGPSGTLDGGHEAGPRRRAARRRGGLRQDGQRPRGQRRRGVRGGGQRRPDHAGSSGRHPAMHVSLIELGSLVMDVDGDRLQAQPSCARTGRWRTEFAIEKNVSAPAPPPARRASCGPSPGRTAPPCCSGPTARADETGFVVERATGDGRFAVLRRAGGQRQPSSRTASVTVGQLYRYQVRATNAAGMSAPSNVADLQVSEQDASAAGMSGDAGPPEESTVERTPGDLDFRCGFAPGTPSGGAGALLIAGLLGGAAVGGRRRRRREASPLASPPRGRRRWPTSNT